ncbi:MAG: hypothetical protein ABIO76_06515 [Ginsengibacter sp.]
MALDFNRYTNCYCPGHLDCKADEEALMEKLTLAVFITPLIALLLNIYFYFYFRNQGTEKKMYNSLISSIIILSFIANFIWEMLQMPFFAGMQFNWQSAIFCALASVADTLMVLILLNGFALFFNNIKWIFSMNSLQIFLLIILGGIGAVLAERIHLNAGSWKYSAAMPIIPILNAGAIPVLQFMFLPLMIFKLIAIIIEKQRV